MKILFKGYAGNGHVESKENEAMGLIVGKEYEVIGWWDCGQDDGGPYGSPIVRNENGKEECLCHDEIEVRGAK